MLIKRTWTWT